MPATLDTTASEIVSRVVARVGAYRESDLVDDLARAMATDGTETAFCVHIGDLNHAMHDPSYVEVLESATYLYADGNSVRIVAAAQGRRLPERLVTTDVIWPTLRRAARGGPPASRSWAARTATSRWRRRPRWRSASAVPAPTWSSWPPASRTSSGSATS